MKKIFTALLLTFSLLCAEEVAVKQLIDCPTAFKLKKAGILLGGRMYNDGGVLTEVGVGLADNFYFGVSYGGTNIIGRGEPEWNGNPGVFAQVNLMDEDYYYPGFALGFNSQGYGAWSGDRYDIKSKGFYGVASKNFFIANNLGTFGLHGGLNYCVTEKDDLQDDNLNFFVGFDKSVGNNFNLLFEYDFAVNDNSTEKNAPTKGYGYMNAGMRWSFDNALHLEFDLKDILKNQKGDAGLERQIRLIYITKF